MAIAAIDLAPGAKIHLFYDPAYTDVFPVVNNEVTAEATELLDSIESFGFDVTTFIGTGAEWVAAAQTADVIVVPAIQSDFTLSPQALFALQQFVDKGGTLIVTGSVNTNKGTDLVNQLFGKAVAEKELDFDDATRESGAPGFFANGPSTVGDGDGNDYTSAWTAASLGDIVSLYQDGAGDSVAATFQFGKGQVVWLGWDWSNAEPSLGQQNNGWLSVLDRSLSHPDGPSGVVIKGTGKNDKVGFDLVAKKFNSTDRDDIIDLRKGNDKAEAGDGHDTMVGGKGNDKLFGEAGLDTLSGGTGKDKLSGGDDADYFVFDVKPTSSNLDKVLDYEDGTDKILLASSVYKGLTSGPMTAQDFADHISYAGTGTLKFDGKAFAKIGQGHDIDETDFFVV